jgi:hypothetical protein
VVGCTPDHLCVARDTRQTSSLRVEPEASCSERHLEQEQLSCHIASSSVEETISKEHSSSLTLNTPPIGVGQQMGGFSSYCISCDSETPTASVGESN